MSPNWPRSLMLAATLTMIPSVASAAQVLLTSQLTALGGVAVSCSVVNGGTKDSIVTIELVESTGAVILTDAFESIAPGRGSSLRIAGGTLSSPHCRVTIEEGQRKNIRAALCVHSGSSSLSSPCLATSEAR